MSFVILARSVDDRDSYRQTRAGEGCRDESA
jgi:hypothetical protein